MTSACFTMFLTRSSPRSDFKLTVMDFLLALNNRKYQESWPWPDDPCNKKRPASPPCGFSTLTTSAPSQASASVQDGPASNWVKSRIRTPARQLGSALSVAIFRSSNQERVRHKWNDSDHFTFEPQRSCLLRAAQAALATSRHIRRSIAWVTHRELLHDRQSPHAGMREDRKPRRHNIRICPASGKISPLQRITAALDLLDQRASLRPPFKFRARALSANAAIGAHGIVGRSVTPFGCRFLDGHALRAAALSKHAADCFAHLAHGCGCGAMAGISGIDCYVGVVRGLSQNLGVV